MQPCVIMAFRKRLKSRGYLDVSICREISEDGFTGSYVVSAVEPLSGTRVSAVFGFLDFQERFR